MRFLITAALSILLAGQANAVPFFGLSWDTCTGPLNRCIAPGEAVVNLSAWVVGQSTAHRGYEFAVEFATKSASSPYPDAWRFDPDGCLGSGFINMRFTAQPNSCPVFERSGATHASSFLYDPSIQKFKMVMSSNYPLGNTNTVDPSRRYALGWVAFEFIFCVNGPTDPGTTCGQLETPMSLHIARATWIEHPAGTSHDYAVNHADLFANDPAVGCAPVPAVPATWGAIRAQYR